MDFSDGVEPTDLDVLPLQIRLPNSTELSELSYSTVASPIKSTPEDIAEAIVPYFPEDGKKSKYLAYRVCGFNMREAMYHVGVTYTSVKRWRDTDAEFARLDTSGLNELKEKLSAKYLNLEFTRNFHLVMQKDFNVLSKSMKNPEEMTRQENQYLLKLRQFYTPQQFAIIQQLVGEATGPGFDFTKLIFEVRREREELRITHE
jgi:hypothetical protein